ncbi:EsaB/YukD family protein [Catenulispora pinisilvae]|uniref:EsaB/YukD family protein n=1 Tax=Catenulispora pinisilvae TaxID=2705253 RepID=UPI001891F353|nr:EsaB/YukD family protein [Catenulispora pinisilvae]
MTAGSGVAGRPGTATGHCRVTVVAPTRRVDVALPDDVPLAELLPELLRLVGDPLVTPAAIAAALTGYVLTGADGVPLDTATSLTEQGVVHGSVLRLRSADDVPEPAVHDDIADAVAEAVIAGGSQWSVAALRATALAVVAVASALGAVVLWSSNTGTFHGWKGLIAGAITLVLFGLAIWRARYDQSAVGRGSYYGYGDSAGPAGPSGLPRRGRLHGHPAIAHDRVNPRDAEPGYQSTSSFGPPLGQSPAYGYSYEDPDSGHAEPETSFDLSSFGADVPDPRPATTRSVSSAAANRATRSVRDGGLGSLAAWPTVAEAMAWATGAHHQRDYTAAVVLSASSLPYAFIAGAGLLSADPATGHGLGRAHFTAGAIAVLIVALAAIIGVGRRIAVPVAGATVGLVATAAGIGLLVTKASPAAGIGVVAAFCALAVELLPFAAMAAARFVIEPPTSGVEPGDFEGSPVNNYVVGLRVARTLDMLTGLTAGVGTLLVLSVALLVIPISAMQTSSRGPHTVWEQALAILVSGVMLCRARLFRERAQVLAAAISGLTGLVIAFSAMAANALPDLRAMWLAPLLIVIALLALGLASIRPRRGTSEPIMPPRWARAVEMVEGVILLAVLPVLMAVLGVYGQVRNLKG